MGRARARTAPPRVFHLSGRPRGTAPPSTAQSGEVSLGWTLGELVLWPSASRRADLVSGSTSPERRAGRRGNAALWVPGPVLHFPAQRNDRERNRVRLFWARSDGLRTKSRRSCRDGLDDSAEIKRRYRAASPPLRV